VILSVIDRNNRRKKIEASMMYACMYMYTYLTIDGKQVCAKTKERRRTKYTEKSVVKSVIDNYRQFKVGLGTRTNANSK